MNYHRGLIAVGVFVGLGLLIALLFGLGRWGWLTIVEGNSAFDRAANVRQVFRELPAVTIGLVVYLASTAWATYAPRTKSSFAGTLATILVLGWACTLGIVWYFLPPFDKTMSEAELTWYAVPVIPIAPVLIGLAIAWIRGTARPIKRAMPEL